MQQSRMTYLNRVELDASLHDIDGGEGSVGDRTTDTSGSSTLEVVHQIIVGLAVSRRGGKEDGTRGLHDATKIEKVCCFMSILILDKDHTMDLYFLAYVGYVVVKNYFLAFQKSHKAKEIMRDVY